MSIRPLTEEAVVLMAMDGYPRKSGTINIRKSAKLECAPGKPHNTLFSATAGYPQGECHIRANAMNPGTAQIRAAIKKRKVFPRMTCSTKVIYLAIEDASKWRRDPELAAGDEPFYYRVRHRLSNHLLVNWTLTPELLTGSYSLCCTSVSIVLDSHESSVARVLVVGFFLLCRVVAFQKLQETFR